MNALIPGVHITPKLDRNRGQDRANQPNPGHMLLYLLRLTIKLGHLLTEFHLPQDSPELGLVNAGKEPAVGIGEGLAEGRLQDLPGYEWKQSQWTKDPEEFQARD